MEIDTSERERLAQLDEEYVGRDKDTNWAARIERLEAAIKKDERLGLIKVHSVP